MKQFLQYTSGGVGAYIINLSFFAVFVELLGWNYLIATVIGFILATTVHYSIARIIAFSETTETVTKTGSLFFVFAGFGLVLVLAFMYIQVDLLGWNEIWSRSNASVAAGTIIFFMNKYLNFKS